ncbi:MAG TPA: hypothetical protein PLU35_12250 [Phycisphaerales bacterium]|nr:hypothetical protein [Phycisphaerales bacterium]
MLREPADKVVDGLGSVRHEGSGRQSNPSSAAAAAAGRTDDAFALLAPALARPPFPLAVRDTLVHLVRRIFPLETARGDIPRTDRSRLSPEAQPHQNLIDRILFTTAGLTDAEAAALTDRLERML